MPRITADDARWIIQVLKRTLSEPPCATEAQQLRAIQDKLSRRLEQNQQARYRSNAARRRQKATSELT